MVALTGVSVEMDTEAGGEGCLGSSAGKEERRERPGRSEAKAARMVCLEARAAQAARTVCSEARAARAVPTGSRAVRAVLTGCRADLKVQEKQLDSWGGPGAGSGELG